jgi:hypothetical protein
MLRKFLLRLMGSYEIEYRCGGRGYSVTCLCGRAQGEQLAALLSSTRHGRILIQRGL